MKFTKMHGAGNDFVLIQATEGESEWPELARLVCSRHYGVGADGLILALHSAVADTRMRMYNPDGSESAMCGNGVRCLARYVVEQGLAKPDNGQLTIETASGTLIAELYAKVGEIQDVRVMMGVPRLDAASIPMLADSGTLPIEQPLIDFSLSIEGEQFHLSCLSIGNPHAVLFSDQPVSEYPLETIGPEIEHHPLFPQGTNFGVARLLSQTEMELRVWERGVGTTLACGSGACAAMVAANLKGLSSKKVDITLPGGTLVVEWPEGKEVYLTGPTESVFEGEWCCPGERGS